MDCIFCKIVNGEIPCYKIYEDERFIAFLDVSPLSPGHTLLIPKKHVRCVEDYEPYGKYWETVRNLSKILQKVFKPETISYIVYGLGVEHAHIHLVPIYKDIDPTKKLEKEVIKIPEKEMKEIAKKIRKEI
ncbi:MAG: HIT family protein [archaeon]|nr:MAG: HIT family protein [archaeon]